MVKPVFKPQLDQNPFRRPSRLFQGPPLNQSGHQGIFQGAEFRKEMVELENKAYVAVAQLRQLTFRPIEKVLPFEKNFSFGGPIQGPQDVQEGALACSGSPLHSQRLSCPDGQIDPLQDFDDFATCPEEKGFLQILGLNQGKVDGRA
jgi:hypothetical protein